MVVHYVCYFFLLSMNLWAEFLPSRRRGILLNALSLSWSLGSCVEITIALVVMPTLGWRWLFFLSSLPLLIFLCLCRVSKFPLLIAISLCFVSLSLLISKAKTKWPKFLLIARARNNRFSFVHVLPFVIVALAVFLRW